MAALPLIVFILGLLLLFIVVWLMLSAYFVVVGTASLIPSVIARRQSGSVLIISSAAAQIVSGILLAFSCIYSIVSIFTSSGYEKSSTAASMDSYNLFLSVLIISIVVACLFSFAGAVLNIIRTFKSRGGRTAPKKITVAASLMVTPSALVFAVFSVLVLIAVLSF